MKKSVETVFRSNLFVWGGLICGILIMLGAVTPLPAAEFRISEEPVSPAVDYNILLFENLRLSLTGVVGLTYDDNINRSRFNEETGVYTTPRLRMGIDWPLTPNVLLGTSTSFGYRYYLSGDGKDRFLVSFIDDLSTSVKADIHIGEGKLRLSNRFSRSADDLEVGRTGARDYVLSRNTIGARYNMPLAPVWSSNLSVSRRDTWTDTDAFEYHDNVRHLVRGNVLWHMQPELMIGPYLSYEDVDYTSASGAAAIRNNDRETWEGGLDFFHQLMPRASLEGNIGYQNMDIEKSRFATEQAEGIAGKLAVNYSSSEITRHTLSVRHDRNQDIVSPFVNYSRETTYMYAVASSLRPRLTVRGDAALVDIVESDWGEDAELLRLGVGASYRLAPKLTASMRYEYWDKNSDDSARQYDRNKVSAFLEYEF